MARFRLKLAALAVLCALPVLAQAGKKPAPAGAQQTAQMLNAMQARLQQLEAKNAALEKQVQQLQQVQQAQSVVSPVKALEPRLATLEQEGKKLEESLASDTISEREPELAARLKAVEMQTLNMQKAVRRVNAMEGLTANVSFTTVAQKPYGVSSIEDGPAASQLNYRGDVSLELPLPNLGNTEQKVAVQFRLGQGRGLNNLPQFAKPNASAFQLSVPDEANAMLAQAWYQAKIPLPLDGYKPHSKESLEISFGKIDPFIFFDQNAAANDETRQFLNTVFVHNPLLDASGDIGVDANGFAPGLQLAYENESQKPQTWRLSLGVFGANGLGANYQRSLRQPLVIAQAETKQYLMGGLAGHYRLYAWHNAAAAHFDENISHSEKHSGWGISVDQRFGDGITAFGRYGQQISGNVRFDRALTVGLDLNGSYWDRAGDTFGIGLGWLRSSQAWRAFSGNEQNERVAELYYRYRLGKNLELSPDFQYIMRPAGSNEAAIKLFGLRAQVSY